MRILYRTRRSGGVQKVRPGSHYAQSVRFSPHGLPHSGAWCDGWRQEVSFWGFSLLVDLCCVGSCSSRVPAGAGKRQAQTISPTVSLGLLLQIRFCAESSPLRRNCLKIRAALAGLVGRVDASHTSLGQMFPLEYRLDI